MRKGDTISRQAAIQTAEQMYKRCDTSSIEDYHDLMVEALTALPSAQPTGTKTVQVDDCISRQAAIDAVHEEFDECTVWDESGEYTADVVERILDDVPAAQQWIPCSERLPSFDFTDVLVSMHDVRHGCEDEYYIASAYVVRGHWEMTLNVDTSNLEIVAWMPLPKPWKGEPNE